MANFTLLSASFFSILQIIMQMYRILLVLAICSALVLLSVTASPERDRCSLQCLAQVKACPTGNAACLATRIPCLQACARIDTPNVVPSIPAVPVPVVPAAKPVAPATPAAAPAAAVKPATPASPTPAAPAAPAAANTLGYVIEVTSRETEEHVALTSEKLSWCTGSCASTSLERCETACEGFWHDPPWPGTTEVATCKAGCNERVVKPCMEECRKVYTGIISVTHNRVATDGKDHSTWYQGECMGRCDASLEACKKPCMENMDQRSGLAVMKFHACEYNCVKTNVNCADLNCQVAAGTSVEGMKAKEELNQKILARAPEPTSTYDKCNWSCTNTKNECIVKVRRVNEYDQDGKNRCKNDHGYCLQDCDRAKNALIPSSTDPNADPIADALEARMLTETYSEQQPPKPKSSAGKTATSSGRAGKVAISAGVLQPTPAPAAPKVELGIGQLYGLKGAALAEYNSPAAAASRVSTAVAFSMKRERAFARARADPKYLTAYRAAKAARKLKQKGKNAAEKAAKDLAKAAAKRIISPAMQKILASTKNIKRKK